MLAAAERMPDLPGSPPGGLGRRTWEFAVSQTGRDNGGLKAALPSILPEGRTPMRNTFMVSVVAVSFLGALPAAHAAQISLGASTSGSILFAGSGTGNVGVVTSALSGSASDPLDALAGTYTISGIGPTTAFATGVSGIWDFVLGTTASLVYTNPSGNSVTENLFFLTVNDGSANPHFAGSDVVTAVSGSPAFTSAWAVGTDTNFTITTNSIATFLDVLANTLGTETTTINNGQDVIVSDAGVWSRLARAAEHRPRRSRPDEHGASPHLNVWAHGRRRSGCPIC